MAQLLRAFSKFFNKHPLAGNGLVYGSLYVGAEFSQQTITRKFLVMSVLAAIRWNHIYFRSISFQMEPPQDIDKPTLGRYAIMGTFVYSPILYNWLVLHSYSRYRDSQSRAVVAPILICSQFVCLFCMRNFIHFSKLINSLIRYARTDH